MPRCVLQGVPAISYREVEGPPHEIDATGLQLRDAPKGATTRARKTSTMSAPKLDPAAPAGKKRPAEAAEAKSFKEAPKGATTGAGKMSTMPAPKLDPAAAAGKKGPAEAGEAQSVSDLCVMRVGATNFICE